MVTPMRAQHTLQREAALEGVGLHSGQPTRVRLAPAPPDTGVVFRCGERDDAPPIAARHDQVTGSRLATTLGGAGWAVSTVEHLLAAIRAEGVDNVEVTVWGGEVPVLDGSAAPWVEVLAEAGRSAQSAARRTLVVTQRVEVTLPGGRRAALSPCDGLELAARIEFDHPDIGTQSLEVRLSEDGAFREQLAWARTFGFLAEWQAMQRAGLGRGGSLDNAVVYGDDGIINPEGLRGADEAVRHKMLDMVGDLALVGLAIEGRLEAVRPGHALNLMLVQALLARPDAWVIREG